MLKYKKTIVFLLVLTALGVLFGLRQCNKAIVYPPNPVPLSVIKELAERYKPVVVFDENTLFYPVRFDGLKKVALEVDKQVVATLDITDELRQTSNSLDHPSELFDNTPTDHLIYYYSLSTQPEQWPTEKVLDAFPDTLSLYVNATYIESLKITYTIPFEGNHWRNYHRGDGAMFALYFTEENGVYRPTKARAYMHLQYNEVKYEKNAVAVSENETRPVFFVTSGSHSTYHRPGTYKNVDGVPFLSVDETTKNDYAYCSDRIQLVFTDNTRNHIEQWAFLGEVYWGGSPSDRIHAENSTVSNIPLIRNIPMGNKSAKMTVDPSAVFDNRHYGTKGPPPPALFIDCK